MSDAVLQRQIAAATAYEQLHVPALFGQWPERLLDAVRVGPGDRVLDVACGTGILARQAAARVGDGGVVAGIDPDSGMLAVAARLAPRLDWRRASAESLPFPDGTFDAVLSQFGLMFFPDRSAALREMLRVLTPRGRLGVAVWDALSNSPAYSTEVALLESLGGQAAADALRAPFTLGDREELSALFESAGVASVTISTRSGTARFPSIRSMVEADLRGWLPVMGVVLGEEQIRRILQAAENALRPYVTARGQVEFDSPAHLVTGARP